MDKPVSDYTYDGIDVENKVVVVIGGPTGMGKAVVRALSQEGAIPVPSNPYKAEVESIVDELAEEGIEVPSMTVDVKDSESLEKLKKNVLDHYGRIDGLVNFAGIHLKKPTEEVTTKEWEEVIDVHLSGTFKSCKVIGSQMIEQDYGSIVNIGSITSYQGLYQVSAYGAAKGGVLAFSKSLAGEWAKYHINVNTVIPGFILTNMNKSLLEENTDRLNMIVNNTPMEKLGNPNDVAGSIIFLLSDASNFITGSSILVDGGYLNASSR